MRVLRNSMARPVCIYDGTSLMAEQPLLVLVCDDEDDVRAAEEIMREIEERRRRIALDRHLSRSLL